MNSDVTIIHSFASEYERPLLESNIDLSHSFNPDSQHRTLIVNNSTGIDEFDADVIPGIYNRVVEICSAKAASDAVATALRIGIREADTRYICIIDPDFFVCLPYWIEEMKAYMEATGVRIIGSAHAPPHYTKRHLLSNNFVFVDTKYIPKVLLNFMPDKTLKVKRPRAGRLLRGTQSDCGDLIERRFPDQIEYLTPAYVREFNLKLKWYDKFLPRQFRYENCDGPYALAKKGHNKYDLYLWNSHVFALHCRAYLRTRIKGYVIPMKEMRDFISQIASGYKSL